MGWYNPGCTYRLGGLGWSAAFQKGPGNIQNQVGRGSEQPDLVEGVPAHCRGIGLGDL